MQEDSTSAGFGARFRRALAAFCRHPFFAMFVLVGVSVTVEEFYPFSHFPMYGNPGPTTTYLFVAEALEDGGYEPIPIRALTGITAPKIKKIYVSRIDDYCDENDRDKSALNDREIASVGQDILDYLRPLALKKTKGKRPLPEKMVLVQVLIEYTEGGGFTETPRTLTDELNPL